MIQQTSHGDFVSTPTVILPAAMNRFVLFMNAIDGEGFANPPDTATFNGQAMTLYASATSVDECTQIWGYCVPNSTPAGNYTITYTGTNFTRWFTAVFSGVSRDSVVDADAVRNGSGTNDGTTLTLDCVNNGWVHDIVWVGKTASAGAGQTVVYPTGGEVGRGCVSYKNPVANGATTMSWSWTDSPSSQSAISLRPYKNGGGIIMY